MPPYRSSAAQSAAQRNGATLEADLDAFHLTLAARGWYVHRKWPSGPQRKKGPPDYMLVSPAGRPFLFDAKSAAGHKWDLKLLAPHQYADLSRFTGEAGIYLRLHGQDWWVPFAVVAPRWLAVYRGGKDSLTANDGYPVGGMDWTTVFP